MKAKWLGMGVFLILALLSLHGEEDPFGRVRDRLRDGSGAPSALEALEELDDQDLTYEGSRLFFEIEYQRLKGRALIQGDRKDEARASLQTCLSLAEEAQNREESSRTLYYLASAGFLLAGIDGVGAIISRADDLNGKLDRALELDPEDGEIVYQKASGLAYPPRLFGGNPTGAIRLLTPLLSRSDLAPYLRFDLLTVYSYGLSKTGEYGKAVEAADEALALYPGNEDMIEKRKEWKRKVK